MRRKFTNQYKRMAEIPLCWGVSYEACHTSSEYAKGSMLPSAHKMPLCKVENMPLGDRHPKYVAWMAECGLNFNHLSSFGRMPLGNGQPE